MFMILKDLNYLERSFYYPQQELHHLTKSIMIGNTEETNEQYVLYFMTMERTVPFPEKMSRLFIWRQ